MTRIWDKEAVVDLFDQYARERDGVRSLNWCDIRDLLRGIGEQPVDATIAKLFDVADHDGNGVIDLEVSAAYIFTERRDEARRDFKVDEAPKRTHTSLDPRVLVSGISRSCRNFSR